MTDLTLVSLLKTRMHRYQARQKVLAENVANANTPGFKPKDLRDGVAAPRAGIAMAQTSPLHLAGVAASGDADRRDAARFETRPSGNSVNVEDEMLKAAQNGADYQLAATLYQKSLAMLRTAATGRTN